MYPTFHRNRVEFSVC